jgi:MarR-like DNA-binding transcriptional regulator SgrR of sgrS sRNA
MYATAEKYLMLLNNVGKSYESGMAVEISIDEIAQALYCTTRNAKMIIRKLIEEGLIEWQSGRGRGNLSRLTFMAEKEPLLMEWAQGMSRKGDYKQAFELLQTNSEGSAVTDRFVHWLNDHFGYQAEQTKGNSAADTLRFPVYCPILTMDPSRVYYAFDAHMVRQVFDRLVEYDVPSGKVLPSLAHSWESNAEATEWTFYLRKGVRFHHGRELRPEDVRFTYERMRGDKPHSWLIRTLKEVQCLGSRAVRIILEQPNYIFPRYVGSAGMSIVPEELVQEDEVGFWKKPVGTGPFRVVHWSDDCFELMANPDYYQGRAHLDRVLIAFMPEETAKLSKNAKWQQLVSNQEQMDLEEDTDWKMVEALIRGCTMMSWNMRREGPQQTYAFRRAFELLVNRKALIHELGEDRMYPARGFRPTEQTPFMEEESDTEEAKRLLKESGYKGEEINLCTYGMLEPDGHWIRRRCEEFGINVRLQVETYVSIKNADVLNNVDCLIHGVCISVEEVCEIENYEQAGNFLKEYLHPRVLEWILEQINKALASNDPQFRRKLLDSIENKLRDEAYVLFLLHRKLNTIIHPTVKGVGLSSTGWMDFRDIWLENRTTIS